MRDKISVRNLCGNWLILIGRFLYPCPWLSNCKGPFAYLSANTLDKNLVPKSRIPTPFKLEQNVSIALPEIATNLLPTHKEATNFFLCIFGWKHLAYYSIGILVRINKPAIFWHINSPPSVF